MSVDRQTFDWPSHLQSLHKAFHDQEAQLQSQLQALAQERAGLEERLAATMAALQGLQRSLDVAMQERDRLTDALVAARRERDDADSRAADAAAAAASAAAAAAAADRSATQEDTQRRLSSRLQELTENLHRWERDQGTVLGELVNRMADATLRDEAAQQRMSGLAEWLAGFESRHSQQSQSLERATAGRLGELLATIRRIQADVRANQAAEADRLAEAAQREDQLRQVVAELQSRITAEREALTAKLHRVQRSSSLVRERLGRALSAARERQRSELERRLDEQAERERAETARRSAVASGQAALQQVHQQLHKMAEDFAAREVEHATRWAAERSTALATAVAERAELRAAADQLVRDCQDRLQTEQARAAGLQAEVVRLGALEQAARGEQSRLQSELAASAAAAREDRAEASRLRDALRDQLQQQHGELEHGRAMLVSVRRELDRVGAELAQARRPWLERWLSRRRGRAAETSTGTDAPRPDTEPGPPVNAIAETGRASAPSPAIPTGTEPTSRTMEHLHQVLAEHDEAFVKAAYRAILGRDPDPDGLASNLRHLRETHDKAGIVHALATSDEGRRHRSTLAGLAELVTSREPRPVGVRRLFNKLWRIELGGARLESTLAAMQVELLHRIGQCQTASQAALAQNQVLAARIDALTARLDRLMDLHESRPNAAAEVLGPVDRQPTSTLAAAVAMSTDAAPGPATSVLASVLDGDSDAEHLIRSLQRQLVASQEAAVLSRG